MIQGASTEHLFIIYASHFKVSFLRGVNSSWVYQTEVQ